MTVELPPDDATLRRFLLGDLPPTDLDAVAHYLDAHPSVATTLVELKADDTLVSALRGPADATDPPEVAAAVARAAGLVGGEPPTESLAPTPIGDATADAIGAAVAAVTDADDADDPLCALAPAEAAGEIGRLGGYRVLRLLGRGGMGAVFEAADDRLGRRVALKVMLPSLAAKASARQRFLREAKAAAAVEHDYIVPIYQTGEDRGVPFLAMPLLAGETLDDRLKGGPLPAADVLRVGREVAEGLAAAHAAGLVHRDIKPSNVWLERTAAGAFKRVRILDFGLARSATGADGLTQSGAVLGTPAYMAPEQARGEAVDARADLFSLGVVLYHAATGRRPFPGSDTFSILTALATTEPTPAARVNPAVPAGLSALVARLLSKNPAGRPASAGAVADELARLAGSSAREAATQVIGVSPADHSGAGGDTTEAFDPTPPRRRVRRGWKVAAAVLFLAVAGLAAANGPTIVRVVTNEGELVVEVDDPATEVVVKGGAVELRREEGGKKRVYLVTATKAGEVEVREPGSTDALVMEKFQLRRGGDVLVKVTADKLAAARRPKAGPPAPSPPASDPDRRLAEWVRSLGGNWGVTVDTPGNRHYCGYSNPTFPSEPFKVQAIRVVYKGKQATIKPEDIEIFRGVTAIKGIDLDNPGINDQTLPRLIDLLPESLERFEFSGYYGKSQISDASLAGITRFRNLRWFGVESVPLTDAACEYLRPHRGLDTLHLWGTKISDAGMSRLTGFTSVARLSLPENTGDDSARPFLATGKLERLTLGKHCTPALLPLVGKNTGLIQLRGVPRAAADADLVHLLPLTLLETLDLQNTQVTGSALAEFRGRPAIVTVNLEGAVATDENLAHLKGYPNLRGVWVGGKTFTDAGVRHLADIDTLAELVLNYSAVTDAGLEEVRRAKSLRALAVYQTGVTEAGVRRLAAARPDLRIDWNGPTIEPKASAGPAALTAAQRAALDWVLANGGHLELRTAAGTPVHLGPASKLPDGPARVVGMTIGDASKHTEAVLLGVFRDLPAGMRGVQLNYAPLTDAGLETLVGFPSMAAVEAFTASGIRVTDDGMRHFRKLPRLRVVAVGYTRVSTAGLAHLRGLPLTGLGVHSSLVDDAAMDLIAEFRDLDTLNLAGTRVTAKGMAALRTLPKLSVLHLGGSTATADALEQAAGCPLVGLVAVANPPADALPKLARFPRLDHAQVYWPNAPLPAGAAEAFAACPRLKVLDLADTAVTRPELDRLAAAMPWCEIKWVGGTVEPRPAPKLPAGDAPPARDAFPGRLVFYSRFNDVKDSRVFEGTRDGTRAAVEGGEYRLAATAWKAGIPLVATFGLPTPDVAFVARTKVDAGMTQFAFRVRTNDARGNWLLARVSEGGRWSVVRVDMTVTGGTRADKLTVLAEGTADDPALAAGRWITVAGRAVGKDYEVWVNGKLVARGTDDPAFDGPGTFPAAFQASVVGAADGPLGLTVDHAAAWDPTPPKAP